MRGASLVLEFLALIMLRIREPQLHRPFKVPGGLPGAIMIAITPTALLIIALIKNRGERLSLGNFGYISSLDFGLILMAVGVVLYFATAWKGKKTQSAPQI